MTATSQHTARVELTVGQVAESFGVTVRTLHHYDEIGLLKPASLGANGYRYYGHVELLRLQRILEEAGASHVDALKIDVEGFEDRVLTGFFAQAPQALWPRAVVIEHLSKNEWQQDCIADMRARGYAETGRTRSNTLLVRT